ncbi:ubiquitin carboxyl-terminal hydrolase-domain-containing protein [Scheffersomyces xylosifermentans]|uniref:ubiquitin carboxyl-terminal hydrolase-domain-containing protein n=1 Tax=Scheffersomyces xylosifermentans TaxID=1304137 RepID=UPI00315D6FFD
MSSLFRRHAATQSTQIFDDQFWGWYLESFTSIPRDVVGHPIPPNPKKYSSSSHSVHTLQKYFEALKLPIPSFKNAAALLTSPFTQGDLIKAFHLARYFQLSAEGLFLTNSNIDKLGGRISYVGAENWENVMCYLDALLFSMFANLESFDPILFISNKSSNHTVNQLAALLRVYISMIRSGNLVTTDITIRICEVLHKLGFKEALSHKQQDSAALFEFLTETLSMPLLTFKIDIKHGGKYSKEDDEKISKERILFVSLPDEDDPPPPKPPSKNEKAPAANPDEEGILLEECLEHYFNNSISVKRELERRATLERINPGEVSYHDTDVIPENEVAMSTISSVNPALAERTHSEAISLKSVTSSTRPAPHKSNPFRYSSRTRSSTLSIWSLNDGESTGGTVKSKEVNLPAWMFLRLLPFYTDDNNQTTAANQSIARNSKEFVNRRPILPICLKRYSFDMTNASAKRSQKRIIIPPIIDLPQFVADDVDEETPGNYRLILESAICHRGHSITSGHFISVVRKDTNNISASDEEAANSTWYLYDDMKKKSRIVEKTFNEIFNTEWPYLLFYRLVTTDEVESGHGSSNSSKLNLNTVPHSTTNPFIPPQGSKNKYWTDDGGNNSPPNSPPSLRLESAVSSTSSVPIADILPTDPRFIDIKNKYFWYVLDKNKNYYKEVSSISKHGTREPSICLSPQFRRNSQWSDKSAVSSEIPTNDLSSDMIDLESKFSDLNTINSGSSPSLFKRTAQKISSPLSGTPKVDSVLALNSTISPVNLDSEVSVLGADKEDNHNESYPIDTEKEDIKLDSHKEDHHDHHNHHHEHKSKTGFHRKRKSARDNYKKEKCSIM